jgi:hypothetical protein
MSVAKVPFRNWFHDAVFSGGAHPFVIFFFADEITPTVI